MSIKNYTSAILVIICLALMVFIIKNTHDLNNDYFKLKKSEWRCSQKTIVNFDIGKLIQLEAPEFECTQYEKI